MEVVKRTYPAKLFDLAAARLQPYFEVRCIAAMMLNTLRVHYGGKDSTYLTLGDNVVENGSITIRYADHANVSDSYVYPDYNCVVRELIPAELVEIERRVGYPRICNMNSFALHVGSTVSELESLLTPDCYENFRKNFRDYSVPARYVRVERALAKLTAAGIVNRFPVAQEHVSVERELASFVSKPGVSFSAPTSLSFSCLPCSGSGSAECPVCRCLRCSGKGEVVAPCSSCRNGQCPCSACAGTGRKKTRVLLIFHRDVRCLQCAGVGRRECPCCRGGKIKIHCPVCKRGDIPCKACGGSTRQECAQCNGLGTVDFFGALQRLQVVARRNLPRGVQLPRDANCSTYTTFKYYSHSAVGLLATLDGIGSKYKFQDADETRLRLTRSFNDAFIRLDIYRVAIDLFWVLRFDSRGARDSKHKDYYQELPPDCFLPQYRLTLGC